MGGAFYDSEGRLRLEASISKGDYENLFSSRRDRLVYEEGADGSLIVKGLEDRWWKRASSTTVEPAVAALHP